MMWPILFNLAVFIFIAAMWMTFIFNLIRSAKRSADKRTNKWAQPKQAVPRAQQPVSNNRQGNRGGVQQFLRQNPVELYRILKENLPDRYKDELKTIFSSANPGVELVKFLRRKDVWPLVQSLVRQEAGPAAEKRRRTAAEKKKPRFVPSSSIEEEDGIADIASITDLLDREQQMVEAEYDAYGQTYDSMLSDVATEDVETTMQRETRLKDAKSAKAKVDKKWLRDAMVASIILERPEHD